MPQDLVFYILYNLLVLKTHNLAIMPLRRTPPPTSPQVCESIKTQRLNTPVATSSQGGQYCSLETDLNISRSLDELSTDVGNVTHRFKRKRPECGNEEILRFMTEMKDMFKELKDHQALQDAKMDNINAALQDIKTQSVALQTSADFLSNKFDAIESQLFKLEAERHSNLEYMRNLEDKIEHLERHKRATCVEIKNIPHTTGETKQGLLNQVISIANVLNTSIDPHYVRDVFRINTKDPNTKTIIVEFTSVLPKEQLIRRYKDFNKSNKTSKFSTETLHIKGPRKPVFISENLTPKMKRLFYVSKEYARSNSFDYCWLSNGKIFLKKKEGQAAVLIKGEEDFKIFKESEKL